MDSVIHDHLVFLVFLFIRMLRICIVGEIIRCKMSSWGQRPLAWYHDGRRTTTSATEQHLLWKIGHTLQLLALFGCQMLILQLCFAKSSV